MSSKETAGSSATPTDDNAADGKPTGPTFTDKEERVLKLAWQCLKSGPPEVDIEKLTRLGDFNTQKTCSNTWGKIKVKLATMAPKEDDAEDTKTPKTPKKPAVKKTTAPASNKRGKKTDDDADDEETEASPAKKPRKSPVKKGNAKTKKEAGLEGGEIDEKVEVEDDD